jgi:alpha-tubulin suppressor-like RCC1 family protein
MKKTIAFCLALALVGALTLPVAAVSQSMLVAGDFHAAALRPDDTVWAWGANYGGQLGDGATKDRETPIIIPGLSGVISLAAGYGHTVALKEDGTVWAWGDNRNGQLGLGDKRDRRVPTQVTALSGVVAIAAGQGYTVALKSDGTVWSWGMKYKGGSFGNGGGDRGTDITTPTRVDITDVTAIAAKNSNTFALKADGTVWAWGDNGYGQLGIGSVYIYGVDENGDILWESGATYSDVPLQVVGLTDVTAIVTGGYHTFAWKSDGTIWAWGVNWHGEFGDGMQIGNFSHSPVQIPGLTDIAAIAAHNGYTMLLKTDGTVWTCGSSNFGSRLDDGSPPHIVPTQVPGLTDVVAVAAGLYFASALQADGTIWCWGHNEFGQLGDGTTFNSSYPVQILGAVEVTLPEDYDDTFTDPYVVIGSQSLTATSATPEITWNESEMRLEIAEGLPVGTYRATLAASDGEGHSATKTVTVRVVKTIFSTGYEDTFWNWIKFIFLFGWVWMWF